MLVESGRLLCDPLMTGFLALYETPHYWWAESGARVDVRPIQFFGVFFDASIFSQPWGMGDRIGQESVLTGGVVLMYPQD